MPEPAEAGFYRPPRRHCCHSSARTRRTSLTSCPGTGTRYHQFMPLAATPRRPGIRKGVQCRE
ncbi:MAG: hypothetical protein AW07_02100 [Candidatus Accumulibacter sp. SK-11]|nr:MAG: hypothetical protein AW07_02100 [Candidatus Accumulibacter sp. SK-11]